MSVITIVSSLILGGCGENVENKKELPDKTSIQEQFTKDTKISDVISHPAFGKYGKLIFPVEEYYYSGETLKNLKLTWYNNIDPDKTVEIVNYMLQKASDGDIFFYDIYTEEEKKSDPAKEDTGLFFFKGNAGEKFAVCNAGGGFAYVGAMHDSFPHALELSKKGYNAFALIYRPGAQEACEDLARAISFVFEHAKELEVDTECYSLWGGSAGARMAAYLGTYGPEGFGGDDLPQPGTVVMQYTGHSEYAMSDPPTYACVGTRDGIANWRTMEQRLQEMSLVGIPTEFHAYEGLAHGFGLGTGTVAEGWIDDAVEFWEEQMIENKPQLTLVEPTPGKRQIISLWEEGKMPAPREYGEGYFDPPDFMPYMTYVPVASDTEIKGAVLLCAGGAFQFRGNEWDTYPTAEKLTEMGYQCFVVDYRLRPYTQEEGALDLARAVRYVRCYANEYGIDEKDIAVVGYSAGGILCGEMVLNWKGDVSPALLDETYIPDTLDAISADAAAIGHIYSFYGRLSVGSTDVDKFRDANLPPTFYAYGTEDPFYRQFMANADAVREAGVEVEEHCYEGQPHGFGAGNEDSDWVPEFDRFLNDIFENN